MIGCARRLGVGLILSFVFSSTASAQSLWEATPYRIQVWLALDDHPRIPQEWRARLMPEVTSRAAAAVGAIWQLEAVRAPDAYERDLLRGASFDADALLDDRTELRDFDKLTTITMRIQNDRFVLAIQELDVATRLWTPSAISEIETASLVPEHVVEAMCDLFVPLTRVEQIKDDQVLVSLRAVALDRPSDSLRHWKVPNRIEVGAYLQPVIRRKDRNGLVRAGAVKPIDWTVLLVQTSDGSEIKCKTYSGFSQPFSTRRSSRVEQLAILMRPYFGSTSLRLVDRSAKNVPLVGYDVYARRPESETSAFVGRTDWQGVVQINPDPEAGVRLLFVKSGNQLLAKLPVLPGYQRSLEAPLRNDERRLEAEGLLLGVQESLIDLVARREVLASRVQSRIQQGKLDEAEALLQELKQLDTKEEFTRRVNQRKQGLSAVDSRVETQIDMLFAETQELLGRFLDPQRVRQLEASLQQARTNPPVDEPVSADAPNADDAE